MRSASSAAGVRCEMTVITCVGDLRQLARRRIPRAIFDYADRGACDELTLRRNRSDLDELIFRQRVAVDIGSISLATHIAGQPASMPVGIAPTGLAGFFHRDGEILGARAAEAANIPFCLSTMSICSIEDVRSAVRKPFWFQIYLMRDRAFNRELIERARAAQCPALVLTLDLQVQGVRRHEIKSGLAIPPRLTVANVLEIARKPRWALGVLRGKRRTFGNLAAYMSRSAELVTLAEWIAAQFDPSVTWKDVEWVRSVWPGKLILKGILDADDAQHACAIGADAIVVSNHGGRQLDSAPSTIAVLPEIVAAVQDRCEVLFDGGVLSGQDVLKALARGARACLVGKAFLYSLAALGEAGVTTMLQIVRRELEVSLALTGQTSVENVDVNILRRDAGPLK